MRTSVPRLMPSTREWRQPYLLSNFDLVTESLTLIAGNLSSPALAISYRRCTPVVVSSVTPLISATALVHWPGLSARELRSRSRMTSHSSLSSSDGDGTAPAVSYSAPLCTNMVASPPSSRIMFGASPSGQVSACSVHHQYSSRLSPFQAKTGMPCGSSGVPSGPTATAAAAWSWVEKMLQDAHLTCAPRAVSVSISTAVWIVMCSEPVIRAPRSGWDAAYSARVAIRPGISCSASWISFRPKSASLMSATLYGSALMRTSLHWGYGGSRPPEDDYVCVTTLRDLGGAAHTLLRFFDSRMLDWCACASLRPRHGSICPPGCFATGRISGCSHRCGTGRTGGDTRTGSSPRRTWPRSRPPSPSSGGSTSRPPRWRSACGC